MAADGLAVSRLTKRFLVDGRTVDAVSDVSFEVAAGEFFTMLGPSGCGKTTTLRMVAGLETPSEGAVTFRGRDLASVPARQRNIGMVFQSYALFPHLSVFENVAYGLRLRRTQAKELARAVSEVLDLLHLSEFADRMPASLSGGQQQRVSIARALVYRPDILLLDEPLANLDAKLRLHMREEIRGLQRRLGIMAIYVTHDQQEAMAISDRVAVFDRGRLIQIGAPARVYSDPTSLFVADFIGKANFIPVRVIKRDGTTADVTMPWGGLGQTNRIVAARPDEDRLIPIGSDGLLMLRPEHLALSDGAGSFAGHVKRVQFLGSTVRYAVAVDGVAGDVLVESPRAIADIREGGPCRLGYSDADAILFERPRP